MVQIVEINITSQFRFFSRKWDYFEKHVLQPMCSPTNAAVMTGRYPHRYGSQTFVQRPYQPTFLKDDETTIADKMVDNGYITSLVGKWHLGYGLRKYTPTSRGFQRFFGSYEVGGDHFNHTVGPNTHALGMLFTLSEGYQQTLDLHRETSTDGGKTMATHEHVVIVEVNIQVKCKCSGDSRN